MVHHIAYDDEGDNAQSLLRQGYSDNGNINVGDTIENSTENQQGYMLYMVILNDAGKKDLELLETYFYICYLIITY